MLEEYSDSLLFKVAAQLPNIFNSEDLWKTVFETQFHIIALHHTCSCLVE